VQEGGYVHAMYLDDNSPIAGGRRSGGSEEARQIQVLPPRNETLLCTLHYGSVLCVTGTMGYKHRELDPAPLLKSWPSPAHDQDHPRTSTARRASASWLR